MAVTGVEMIVAELKHGKQAELWAGCTPANMYRTWWRLRPCNALPQVLALRPDVVSMQYNKPMALLKTWKPDCKWRADDSRDGDVCLAAVPLLCAPRTVTQGCSPDLSEGQQGA